MAKAQETVAAFCRALWTGDHRTVARLVSRVDPNGRDRWDHSPLLTAAQFGELAVVEQLVARGGDVQQGRTHLTPITLAARRGASDLVRFLKRAGAKPSVVIWVYLGDRARVARALARDPALATLRDEEGTPLVHHAAVALRTDLVVLLLERGAAVSDPAPDGTTALHRVADARQAPQDESAAMARLLLDRGADPDARDRADVTPPHRAVRARNLAVAEVLCARGADPNARDRRGSTPLRRAVSNTGASRTAGTAALMVPLARLLLAHGADPDARDARGVPVRASARDPQVRALLAARRR